ncbi:unknown [La Crosse virus]|uniref:Uncharacterized protein n=1 Tax=Bunyavirus La Crosse TaxID=11577 RepID=Q83000_BUNLC|nr:unknown [La Crosse virus]
MPPGEDSLSWYLLKEYNFLKLPAVVNFLGVKMDLPLMSLVSPIISLGSISASRTKYLSILSLNISLSVRSSTFQFLTSAIWLTTDSLFCMTGVYLLNNFIKKYKFPDSNPTVLIIDNGASNTPFNSIGISFLFSAGK